MRKLGTKQLLIIDNTGIKNIRSVSTLILAKDDIKLFDVLMCDNIYLWWNSRKHTETLINNLTEM